MRQKKPKKGSTLYVVTDPNAKDSMRMTKAVKGEGMPTYKNPFVSGNLFLILTIEFPEKIEVEAQQKIRSLLPPPLNVPSFKEDDPSVEVHNVTDIDPVESYNSNKVNMASGTEAYDEDEESGGGMGGMGGQRVQCAQQ